MPNFHYAFDPFGAAALRPQQRCWRAREAVAHEGDRPSYLLVVAEGWAAQHRMLADGSRQITELYLPGDICEPFWLEGEAVAQPVIALSSLRGTIVPLATIRRRADREPSFKDALWRHAQWSAARKCELIVSLARRDAVARVCHVFCELLLRQQMNGSADSTSCDLPLTQQDLADLLGITPVHTNRTLQWLRSQRLIEVRGKRLTVLDLRTVRNLAGFDGRYLSLQVLKEVIEQILSPERRADTEHKPTLATLAQ